MKMNIINIYNYKIYITDSCYLYLLKNKKKKFFYKIFVKNKGNINSKTILYYTKNKINLFNKIIKINNIFLLIDILSICFLKNTCLHYKKKIFINSPNSCMNFFLENKILNKIIFLINYIINKKLLIHNGYIKILFFNLNKKILILSFKGECNNCNISKKTFNYFIKKILIKIKKIKQIKI